MFTDELSPFRPNPESRTGLLVSVSVLVGALGGYAFSEWRHAPALSAIRTAPVSRPALSAAPSPVLTELQGGDARPRLVAAPAPPSPVERRVPTPERSTLYLCKAYSGGSFWSSTSCQAQRATIDRIATVPGHLPFEQQVAIANGEAQEAAALYAATGVGVTAGNTGGNSSPHAAECAAFDEALRNHDAAARMPQSGQVQDGLRQQRMRLLSFRAARGC